jgi:hypothetical protein
MIDEPYRCPVPPNPDKPLRKPCNGSANAYFKHLQRGEPACDTSKRALALAKRRSRKTGLWDGTLPFLESEDDMHRRLLTPEQWDAWQAKVQFKTSGPRPKRFEHEEFYADPHTPE